MKLLEVVLDDIHAAIEDSIVNFTDRFPPQESPPQLSALLHLLDLLRELQCFTSNSSTNSTEDTQHLIQHYITVLLMPLIDMFDVRAASSRREISTVSAASHSTL
jgi:hypothetical protein